MILVSIAGALLLAVAIAGALWWDRRAGERAHAAAAAGLSELRAEPALSSREREALSRMPVSAALLARVDAHSAALRAYEAPAPWWQQLPVLRWRAKARREVRWRALENERRAVVAALAGVRRARKRAFKGIAGPSKAGPQPGRGANRG